MIRSKGGTVIGGAFWTPGATVIGGTSKKTFDQLIQSLFANNEQGFFYDPNDLSTMFQDAAGTVPVTAAGQPVGLIRDKSGRNNHAYQATSASRPILRKNAVTGAYYLEFDGSDDYLRTSNIDLTSTDKVSLFAGVRTLSDVTTGMLCELSNNLSNNNGGFYFTALSSSATPKFSFLSKGTTLAIVQSNMLAAPISAALSGFSDLGGDSIKMRANGETTQKNSAGQGGGNFGNYPLYIGRRGGTSLTFNGHIYSLIGVGKLVSDNETLAIEKELAKRAGVTLNV